MGLIYKLIRKSKNLSLDESIKIGVLVEVKWLKIPKHYTKTFSDSYDEMDVWYGYKECFDDKGSLYYQCSGSGDLAPNVDQINDVFGLSLICIELDGHKHRDYSLHFFMKIYDLDLPPLIQIDYSQSFSRNFLYFSGNVEDVFTDVPIDISECIWMDSSGLIVKRQFTKYVVMADGKYSLKIVENYVDGN